MVETLLRVDGLEVERGGRLVLSGLCLALQRGETVLVAGRNGAGKSTLLRTLAGLLPAQAGRIAYGLADADTRGIETAHYLGYEDALKPTLTVEENLVFWASMLSDEEDGGGTSVDATLAAFGIGRLAALPAAYLSAGQKRRVALARLLLAPRPIWLLDEPLIALDTGAQATLTTLMADHVATGGAILVASHQPLALPHRILNLAAR